MSVVSALAADRARIAAAIREEFASEARSLRVRLDEALRERDAAIARLAEVERERDSLRGMVYEINDDLNAAQRVARRLADTGQKGCGSDAERDAFDEAVMVAIAYEVEP